MNLLDSFSKKSVQELVIILESGDDYTQKAKEAATTILELKKIELEELKLIANNYWKSQISDNIKSLLLVKEKPKSFFLNEAEITDLFKGAFDKWKENQETFEIDTTKYWFV